MYPCLVYVAFYRLRWSYISLLGICGLLWATLELYSLGWYVWHFMGYGGVIYP